MIIGIDYSLNNPAICVADDSFDFNKCYFYFLTHKKKDIGKLRYNIIGTEHKEYNTPVERFSQIADWSLNIIRSNHSFDNSPVFIEGYSFGSKGQAVFQIAENCGILKYKILIQPFITYETLVPSVVKKHATGKGNADKQLMYDTFTKETKFDLKKILDMEKLNNPVTDLVDSFYIAKTGFELSNE